MNKIYLLIIIVVIVGGAWFVLQEGTPASEQAGQEQEPEDMMMSTLLMLMEGSETETASLVGVEGNQGSGTAWRLYEQGTFSHAVVANMADPAQGSVYEGWLVQPSPLQFFSTGVMSKNKEGKWQLEYTGSADYPTYNRVIITEETVVDATPEAHILQGDF